MMWQPIETAPKGRYLLLCIWPVYRCFVGLKNIHGEFSSITGTENGYAIKLGPTHWMELPDEPNKHPGVKVGDTFVMDGAERTVIATQNREMSTAEYVNKALTAMTGISVKPTKTTGEK